MRLLMTMLMTMNPLSLHENDLLPKLPLVLLVVVVLQCYIESSFQIALNYSCCQPLLPHPLVIQTQQNHTLYSVL
jgi:hypothetical protein